MIAGIAPEISNIEVLDLSNNEFGDEGTSILAEGLCNNRSIKELKLCDNFTKARTKSRGVAIDNLIDFISSEVVLEKLDISASRSDYELKADLVPLIYSLATNDSITELDISGHNIGDKGVLLSNSYTIFQK